MTVTLDVQAINCAVVKSLNRQQANTLVAYLNYKKYYWMTQGPLFRDYIFYLRNTLTKSLPCLMS